VACGASQLRAQAKQVCARKTARVITNDYGSILAIGENRGQTIDLRTGIGNEIAEGQISVTKTVAKLAGRPSTPTV